jgi:uncharacterized integral membrane protein
MAKDTIKVDGEDVVVREDTAKSYRGVMWALLSVGIIVAIIVVLFIGGFIKTASDGNLDKSPAEIESQRQ